MGWGQLVQVAAMLLDLDERPALLFLATEPAPVCSHRVERVWKQAVLLYYLDICDTSRGGTAVFGCIGN